MTLRKLGTYELLELLGEGGIGQVYAARDTVLGRQVAIKMLRSELSRDRDFIARFYTEAQSLGDLSHANITTLYGLHLEGREPFMVMELVHGRTLEALLERIRSLSLRDCLAIVAQAVAGLGYAHRRGVIHRDIKPANLMVTDSGLLKIMDFGIARVRGTQRLTRAGQMFGTLLYGSPEQIKGNDVDERSDVYSLAVVLYEMLAGAPPFMADNDHALMTMHLETPPPPLTARVRGLDPSVEPAVMRALAKRPEDRFASIAEFGRAIGATAIRGDASDILQDSLGAVFRHAPPQTRYLAAHSAPQARNSDNAVLGSRRSGHIGMALPHGRLRAVLRSPVTILGAVVVALALGAGYVSLWPKRPIPPGRQIAAVEAAKLTPSPVPVAPVAALAARIEPPQLAPKRDPPPSAALDPPKPAPALPAPPPNPPSPAPSGASSVMIPPSGAADSARTLLPWAPGGRQTAALPSPLTPSPVPVEPALAFPKLPKPDLLGTVSGIWSSSRIRVGEHWIDLYGINDPTQHAHTQDMLAYLKQSRGVVECYEKTSGKYQCYADGKDLAMMALSSGLAHAASDAPAEYRALSAPPMPGRH